MSDKLEKLASLEHEQWVSWAQHLMESEKLSPERCERWRKLFVHYSELSEEMKEHDRRWARMVIDALKDDQDEKWPINPDGMLDIEAWSKTFGPWKGPWAGVFMGRLNCYTQDKAAVTTLRGKVHVLRDVDDRSNVVGFTGKPQDIADALAATVDAESIREECKARYRDLPVTADSLDMATAFVRRWFGHNNKDQATDAHELARMFDAVRAEARAEFEAASETNEPSPSFVDAVIRYRAACEDSLIAGNSVNQSPSRWDRARAEYAAAYEALMAAHTKFNVYVDNGDGMQPANEPSKRVTAPMEIPEIKTIDDAAALAGADWRDAEIIKLRAEVKQLREDRDLVMEAAQCVVSGADDDDADMALRVDALEEALRAVKEVLP